MKGKYKTVVEAVIAVVLAFALFNLLGHGCPIRLFTGVSCPGCGMTRAWLSILRFDFKSAFMYHPLFWIPPVGAALWLFRRKIPNKLFNILTWIAAILFIAVWLIRLFDPKDQIVEFKPTDSLGYRLIRTVTSK